VGFTGAPRPWHGLDLLFEAVARARRDGAPLHLLIVGDGPSVPDLARQVAESDLRGAVTFTGRLGHEQIPAYVASFDIGVSPRATFYASPMKVPEYMACGVATVAPRMSNLEDLITDGVDGCLFEPESVEDLANVLGRLAGDAAYRDSIGSTGRQAILAGRTWNDCAARIASVASTAVQARARRRLRARPSPVSLWKPAISQRLSSIWVAFSTSVAEKVTALEWLKGSFPIE
jgi:glycosyltransferase involved in cell wall biosynthesis